GAKAVIAAREVHEADLGIGRRKEVSWIPGVIGGRASGQDVPGEDGSEIERVERLAAVPRDERGRDGPALRPSRESVGRLRSNVVAERKGAVHRDGLVSRVRTPGVREPRVVLDGQVQDPGVARIEGEELEEPPRTPPIHGGDVVEQVVLDQDAPGLLARKIVVCVEDVEPAPGVTEDVLPEPYVL